MSHPNYSASIDALFELHNRLRATGLRSHFKAKYRAVYLLDFVCGVRFIMGEDNGVKYLTIGLLHGFEKGAGRLYRDYMIRHYNADVLIERALDIVHRLQDFDQQLAQEALASFQSTGELMSPAQRPFDAVSLLRPVPKPVLRPQSATEKSGKPATAKDEALW
jgi:hypothetical protein